MKTRQFLRSCLCFFAPVLFAAGGAAMAEDVREPEPIEVMVIGTYHFANHNRDLHNVRSDDVLGSDRQLELTVLAEQIAQWRPTKILVEVEPGVDGQRLTGPRGEFNEAILSSLPGEEVQIGYRVAALVRAPVFAINEQPDSSEPDYFPFGRVASYAAGHNQTSSLAAMQRAAEESAAEITSSLATHSIPAVLATLNSDAGVERAHRPYLQMLQYGDLVEQPGAELYGYWMMRNAKIFGKAMLVISPGDRVLIIYGAGHAYWLRHFAKEMPGYRIVSAFPVLTAAATAIGY